jgi:hypothetical protein
MGVTSAPAVVGLGAPVSGGRDRRSGRWGGPTLLRHVDDGAGTGALERAAGFAFGRARAARAHPTSEGCVGRGPAAGVGEGNLGQAGIAAPLAGGALPASGDLHSRRRRHHKRVVHPVANGTPCL